MPQHGAFSFSPIRDDADVTPDDAVDLPGGLTRGLYVGSSGDLEVMLEGKTTSSVYKNVPVGILQIAVVRVKAGLTTASYIKALY